MNEKDFFTTLRIVARAYLLENEDKIDKETLMHALSVVADECGYTIVYVIGNESIRAVIADRKRNGQGGKQ